MNQQVTYRIGRGPQAKSPAPRGGNTLLAWIFDVLPRAAIFPALFMGLIFFTAVTSAK